MTNSLETLSMNWNYPTPIRFGPGRIQELAGACRELLISRPLLITDEGLADSEIVERAISKTSGHLMG